jgi:ParB family chromosome partitioning protein
MSNPRKPEFRGLAQLIPGISSLNEAAAPKTESTPARTLPIARICRDEHQPRVEFDDAQLEELANSIKAHGLIQPIIVRPIGNDQYRIVAGERRYRAAQRAKLTEVPVVIRADIDDQTAYELALIENLQRVDLNPVEEARAFDQLIHHYQLTQEQIAQAIGKDRRTVTNSMRLLKLPDEILELLSTRELSAGHARVLIPLEDPKKQIDFALRIIANGWSVRETERRVKALLEPEEETEAAPEPQKTTAELAVEDQLRSVLGAPIRLVNRQGKGKIEIRFHNLDELQRLIDLIAKLEGK